MVAIISCSAAFISGTVSAGIVQKASNNLPEASKRHLENIQKKIKCFSCSKLAKIAFVATVISTPLAPFVFIPSVATAAAIISNVGLMAIFGIGYVLTKRGIDVYNKYDIFRKFMQFGSALREGSFEKAKALAIDIGKELVKIALHSALDPNKVENIKQTIEIAVTIQNDLRASMKSGISENEAAMIISAMRIKSREIPQELRALMQKYPEQKKLLENYKQAVATLEKQIADAQKGFDHQYPEAVKQIEAEVNAKIKKVETLTTALENQDQQISDHMAKLSTQKDQINALILNLSSEIENKALTLAIAHLLPGTYSTADAESHIKALKEKVQEIGKEEAKLQGQKAEIATAQETLKQRPEEIRAAGQISKAKLAEQKGELKNLTAQKDALKAHVKHMEAGFKLYTDTTRLQIHSFKLWESLIEGTTANFLYLFNAVGQDIKGKSVSAMMEYCYANKIPEDLYRSDKSGFKPLERTQSPSHIREAMERSATKRHPAIAQNLAQAVILLSKSRTQKVKELEALRQNEKIQSPQTNNGSAEQALRQAAIGLYYAENNIKSELKAQEISRRSIEMQKPIAAVAAGSLQVSGAASKHLLNHASKNHGTRMLAAAVVQASPKLGGAVVIGSNLLAITSDMFWGSDKA